MRYGIAALLLLLAVVGIVLFRRRQEEKRAEEERQRRIAEEEERQRRIAEEEAARKAARKAEIDAGKELYHYLNQSMKTMYHCYCSDQWNQLEILEPIGLKDREAAKRCIGKLPAGSRKLINRFFSCLDYDENYVGEGKVLDSEKMKTFFEQMMLPFFPVYYKEFRKGPRYISFLNQKILKLYTQLSGKKLRVGYKNKYSTGQAAYEWKDDIYRVYTPEGRMLCEASFANGKVKDGYAVIKQYEDDQWVVSQSGRWKDGELLREDTQYRYKVSIANQS